MNCAVIVETRALHNLVEIISKHMKFLPGWDLVVFGSDENENAIKENFPEAQFVNIHAVKFDASKYNRLLTDPGFWKLLLAWEKVLIFQHDSMILREGIEAFFEWCYIGAPWYHIKMNGGNGGLSLRTTKKMFECCEIYKYDPYLHGNEDIYFCIHLPLIGCEMPTNDIAKTFSVETIFYPTPWGLHAADKWMSKEQMKILVG